MRPIRYLAAVPAVALAATGIAIAASPGATTKEVAATFTTSAPQQVNIKTCTGADGTYKVEDAVYNGTATGTLTEGATDALTIRAHTTVNETTGDGIATGGFQLKNANKPVANGSLNAVVTSSTSLLGSSSTLNGLLIGHGPGAPPPPPPPQHLVANFTAVISAAGITGQIGGNGPMVDSAVSQTGSCPPPPLAKKHKKPHHAHVEPSTPRPSPAHKPTHH